MRRKLSEISSYEVILCLFVVMIHLLSESIAFYDKGTVLSFLSFAASRALTFAVPGFVMSAGIKFANKYEHNSFNYPAFLKGRLLKIYIPYVIFAILYYLYFVFYRKYFDFSFGKMLDHLLHGSIAAPFYFIVLIMQFYILSPIIRLFYKILPQNAGILVAAIISILFVIFGHSVAYNDRIFLRYFLYWIIGCYLGTDFRTSISRLSRQKKTLVISGTILTILYIGLSYAEYCGIYNSVFTELTKIAFCISVSLMYLVLMPKSVGFMADQIAPVTFYVFLVHCLIIIHTQFVLDNMSITSVPVRFFITFFITYLLSLLISVVYLKLKQIINNIGFNKGNHSTKSRGYKRYYRRTTKSFRSYRR